jgi:hypothetical protein
VTGNPTVLSSEFIEPAGLLSHPDIVATLKMIKSLERTDF